MFSSNELVLICSLLTVPIAITSEIKGLIEPQYIHAGATINEDQKSDSRIQVISAIFEKNSSYPEIYKNLTELIRYPPQWRSRQFSCSKALKSLINPTLKTAYKFDTSSMIDRTFHQFEEDIFKQGKLNIDSQYKNKNYTCILFELCNLKEERIKPNVKIISEDDLMENEDGVNLGKLNAVFRTKQGVETSYVASITKGTCVAQTYAFENDIKKELLFRYYADRKPVFTSPLVSATNNEDFVNWTTKYLTDTQSLLLNFENLLVENQTDIFKHMESNAIRDFNLVKLQVLGDKVYTPKSVISKNLQKLIPGDTLNVTALKDDSVTVINTLNAIAPVEKISSDSDDLVVKSSPIDNGYEFESACPFERLGIRSNNHLHDHEDLETFGCLVKAKKFGIPEANATFLTEKYQRMEVRVCQTIEIQKLAEPLSVINWNEKFSDFGYNVMIDENIILRYPAEGETHFVSAVHRGDCLYQALIYMKDDVPDNRPLFKSNLLSVSGDPKFIESVSKLLDNTNSSSTGLHQVTQNQTLRAELKKLFRANAVLSINLRSLHAQRSLPQIDLYEHYDNFGSSLQASLITVFMAMVTAKFFY